MATVWRYIEFQRGRDMPDDIVVRARLDPRVKEEAAAVLATLGLTVSDAFRLMMTRIATDKALEGAQ